jgi:hypothetical protein
MLRLHSHMLEFPLMKVLLESLRTGRPSRVLIEKVSVLADREPLSPPKTDPLRDLVEDACSKI